VQNNNRRSILKPKLVVLSADALVYDDLEYLKTLPNFKKYLAGGAEIKSVRSIYPTVTYPVHASISSGTYPEYHKVISNYEFRPGTLKLPWHWFHTSMQAEDIFDAAKKAGLTSAAIYWPLSAEHPSIDYLIGEYWIQDEKDTVHEAFARIGTSDEMMKIIDKNNDGLLCQQHPSQDNFIIDCACDIIDKYYPDVIFIHPANIDGYRHQFGLFNEKVIRGVEETDEFIGRIFNALERKGPPEDIAFFLISDHGQIDIKRIININVIFAENGFIRYDDNGIRSWDVYSLSNGASALIFLKDPKDGTVYEKTHALLKRLCEEGIYGIGRVFTEPEIRDLEHLGGDFSFVLETDGYTAFGDDWKRPLVKKFDHTDYRYGSATHGYLPDKGPQPVLLARGKGIRNGVVLEKASVIDEAPTFAKLLGLALPGAEGTCITEILQPIPAIGGS
jgi:predicted AlkP superfamily pyrophosphatase or phosphodiesterase